MGVQQILSDNMKRLRKHLGITQAILAERIDSSTGYIAEIETQKKFPSPIKFEAIAEALDVEPYVLLMPVSETLGSDSKSALAYKITEEIRFVLNDIEKEYSASRNKSKNKKGALPDSSDYLKQ